MHAYITYVVTTIKSSGVCKQSLASFQYNLKKNTGKVRALYAKKSDDVVYCVRNVVAHGDAREGKWRGNWRMEWVASTLTRPRNVVYPALLTLMRTPPLPAVDWTDSPADLNGFVRLGERRNVVSARVPSGSARALQLKFAVVVVVVVVVGGTRERKICTKGLGMCVCVCVCAEQQKERAASAIVLTNPTCNILSHLSVDSAGRTYLRGRLHGSSVWLILLSGSTVCGSSTNIGTILRWVFWTAQP